MRIAILGHRGIPPAYEGTETVAWELALRLADRGHDVTMSCRRGRTFAGLGAGRSRSESQ